MTQTKDKISCYSSENFSKNDYQSTLINRLGFLSFKGNRTESDQHDGIWQPGHCVCTHADALPRARPYDESDECSVWAKGSRNDAGQVQGLVLQNEYHSELWSQCKET